MGKKCIGIDIGGTTVKLGLFTVDGELLDKWEVVTRKEEDGKYILEDVAASIKAVLGEKEIEIQDVVGVGMGVPGPVLPNGYVEVCVNLGWRNKNPQTELSNLLNGILVKSGNDANVAALGEMWQGGGKGYTDIPHHGQPRLRPVHDRRYTWAIQLAVYQRPVVLFIQPWRRSLHRCQQYGISGRNGP